MGRGGDEVSGDGESSPSSLLNLATSNKSNCVPKTVPEFNSFLYRPRLLTRQVRSLRERILEFHLLLGFAFFFFCYFFFFNPRSTEEFI